MYNERSEGGDPNLSSFMFNIHLIMKACRAFSMMMFACCWVLLLFLTVCSVAGGQAWKLCTCGVIQVIRKVQIWSVLALGIRDVQTVSAMDFSD